MVPVSLPRNHASHNTVLPVLEKRTILSAFKYGSIWTTSGLTPDGVGPPSVRGIDASKLDVILIGKKTYPATVINQSYVDGEYWLVMQAPTISDPAEGDLFDLQVCMCKNKTGTCRVQASNQKSVAYGQFLRNQMIALDRSGSMGWYGGVKFDAAKNAAILAVDAGGDSDVWVW